MPKICMPTFGNGLNNTKNRMHLPLSCPISNMYWIPGAIFSAVNKLHAGIPPDCGHLAEKLALVALRLFPRPLFIFGTACTACQIYCYGRYCVRRSVSPQVPENPSGPLVDNFIVLPCVAFGVACVKLLPGVDR